MTSFRDSRDVARVVAAVEADSAAQNELTTVQQLAAKVDDESVTDAELGALLRSSSALDTWRATTGQQAVDAALAAYRAGR